MSVPCCVDETWISSDMENSKTNLYEHPRTRIITLKLKYRIFETTSFDLCFDLPTYMDLFYISSHQEPIPLYSLWSPLDMEYFWTAQDKLSSILWTSTLDYFEHLRDLFCCLRNLFCQACFIIKSISPTLLHILTVLHVLFHVFFRSYYQMHTYLCIVFGSPVWSGLLTPRAIDCNRNWSFLFWILEKTRPNRCGLVHIGFLQLHDWS